MTYTFPSDLDRAENDQLNDVCEQLEQAIDDIQELQAHVDRLLGSNRQMKEMVLESRKTAREAQRERDKWKLAIDRELVVSVQQTVYAYTDPKQALDDLVQWHVDVTLDPRVGCSNKNKTDGDDDQWNP